VEIDEDPPERQERRIDDEPKSDLRPCPMCGELIKSSALKCRYCGEMVDEEERAERNRPIVVTPTKSVGIAILLTILFGPLGMLYSTVPGALIMMGVNASIFFLSICTGGLGAILFLFTWPICVVWGAVAASSYNAKLMAGGRGP
jgi:hypothetical protein